MERQELDAELEELEYRLERLRALYEQYFLGIEKIEPSVARKDVDRRFWMLRRVQIRNTARRFKLQTLVQRYNTFQQYWQRTCREIENGTYARHLLRAKRRMGEADARTWAAKRRLGLLRRQDPDDDADRGTLARERAEEDLAELLRSGLDGSEAAQRAVDAALAAVEPVPAPAGAAAPSALNPLSLDLDLDVESQRGAAPGSRTAPAPLPVSPPRPRVRSDDDLDRKTPTASQPPPMSNPPPPPVGPPVRVPPPTIPRAGGVPAFPKHTGAAPGARPAAPLPGARSAAQGLPVNASGRTVPRSSTTAAGAVPQASGGAPAVGSRGGPEANPPARARPAVAVPQEAPRAPKPEAQASLARAAAQPPRPGPGRDAARVEAGGPAPRPSWPVLRRQKPGGSPEDVASAAHPRPAPAQSSSLSRGRVEELHAQLIAAKRKLNQRGAVSVDGLAKTLRATEDKLRSKHKGREVDFRVVIRDGQAIVKPIFRK